MILVHDLPRDRWASARAAAMTQDRLLTSSATSQNPFHIIIGVPSK